MEAQLLDILDPNAVGASPLDPFVGLRADTIFVNVTDSPIDTSFDAFRFLRPELSSPGIVAGGPAGAEALGLPAGTFVSPEQVPGFSDVPLIVDVLGATPQAANMPMGGSLPEVSKMDLLDTAGIDFPSARPTSLLDLFNTGLGLAQSFVESPSQVPATIPNVGTLSVNATACPIGPNGKRYHLRKTQVKARKSPVTQCVRNRSMNSLNPHALRRATRRLNGFMNHVKSAEKAIRHALGHTLAPRHRTGASKRSGCYTCGRPRRSCVC